MVRSLFSSLLSRLNTPLSALFLCVVLSAYSGCLFLSFKAHHSESLQEERNILSRTLNDVFSDIQEISDFLAWHISILEKLPPTQLRFFIEAIPLPEPCILSLISRCLWHPTSHSLKSLTLLIKKSEGVLLLKQPAPTASVKGQLTIEIPLKALQGHLPTPMGLVDCVRITQIPSLATDEAFFPLKGKVSGETGYALVFTKPHISLVRLFLKKHGALLAFLYLVAAAFYGFILLVIRLSKERTYWKGYHQETTNELKAAAHLSHLSTTAQRNADRLTARLLARSKHLTSPSQRQESVHAFLGEAHLTHFAFQDVFEHMLAILKPLCWKNKNPIHLVNKVKGLRIKSDSLMVELLLANILADRVHHLPRGSSLSITLQREQQCIVIQVVDNGYESDLRFTDRPYAFSLSRQELAALLLKIEMKLKTTKNRKGQTCTFIKIPCHQGFAVTPTLSPNVIPFPKERN